VNSFGKDIKSKIIWDGKHFAMTSNHNLFLSEDGLEWRALYSFELWGDELVFGNGLILTYKNSKLIVSDGISVQTTGLNPAAILWDGTRFIASLNGISTSEDGLTWTVRESSSVKAIAYGAGRYLACSSAMTASLGHLMRAP